MKKAGILDGLNLKVLQKKSKDEVGGAGNERKSKRAAGQHFCKTIRAKKTYKIGMKRVKLQ